MAIGGCGSTVPAATKAGPSAQPPAAGTAAPTVDVTRRPPTPRPTPGGTLPASGREVQPGTYTWAGFTPRIQLVLTSGGWLVGHRHDEFFDLFPTNVGPGEGPGVGFGRFDAAYGAGGPEPMVDAASVVAALRSNPAVEVEDVGAARLGGLAGLTVDVRVTAPQTAVFFGRGGAFHLDPDWVGRYRFLDLPGGVLVVSVIAREAHLAEGLALAQPILDGFRVAP